MTLRLNFIRETDLARFYEFKDGTSTWIPRSVVKSTTKFPSNDLAKPSVHEIVDDDWWWDKYMEENE